MFVGLNWMMAVLFVFAAVVQVNDPDPLPWICVYLAAAGVCARAASRGVSPLLATTFVGVAALVWGLMTAAAVPSLATYSSMFDAWEMRSVSVEQAREASGLLLVAAWMAGLAVHHTRRSRHATGII